MTTSRHGTLWHNFVVVALINLTLVVGLYVFAGLSGVFTFGSIGFTAIGAYTAALLVIPPDQKLVLQPLLPKFIAHAHFGAVLATLIGGVVAALVAAVVSIPLMRLNGIAAGLATFALLVIIYTVANSWEQVTNGAAGISGVPQKVAPSLNVGLSWAAVAIVCGDEDLTYGELNRRANRLAHHLQRLGVRPDARVGICTERGLEIVVGLLAVLKSGGAYVPFDPAYPLDRLRFMLADSDPVAEDAECLNKAGAVLAAIAAAGTLRLATGETAESLRA